MVRFDAAIRRFAGLLRALAARVLNPPPRPYRPEFHYMRGPGPKWREKHGSPDKARHA